MPQYPSVPFGRYPQMPEAPTTHPAQIVGQAASEAGKVLSQQSKLATLYEEMKQKRTEAELKRLQWERGQEEKERAAKEGESIRKMALEERKGYYDWLKMQKQEAKEAKKEKEKLVKPGKMPKTIAEGIYTEVQKNMQDPAQGYDVKTALTKISEIRQAIDTKRRLLNNEWKYYEEAMERQGEEGFPELEEAVDPASIKSQLTDLEKRYNELNQLEETLKAQGAAFVTVEAPSAAPATPQQIPSGVTAVPQELLDIVNSPTTTPQQKAEAQAMIDQMQGR